MAIPSIQTFTGFPMGIGAPGQEQMAVTPPIALPQGTTKIIYTITGGPIMVIGLVGVVTTVIGAVANATKLTATPTVGGAATDICATSDINGTAAGSLLSPQNSFATALVITTAGVFVNGPSVTNQLTGFVMAPGTILVNCVGSDGGTGRVQWYMRYVPMILGTDPRAMTQIVVPLS